MSAGLRGIKQREVGMPRGKKRMRENVIDTSRTSQECQETDIDIEKDIDKEREKEIYKEKDAERQNVAFGSEHTKGAVT